MAVDAQVSLHSSRWWRCIGQFVIDTTMIRTPCTAAVDDNKTLFPDGRIIPRTETMTVIQSKPQALNTQSCDPELGSNVGPDRPVPKAKKTRLNTERVEGIALERHWNPAEMNIPPDGKWKLMGPEWLNNLKKAKFGTRMHSTIKTKGHMLAYVMQGTVPTEKAGQTMWKLSHCRQPFDVLIRTIWTLSGRLPVNNTAWMTPGLCPNSFLRKKRSQLRLH